MASKTHEKRDDQEKKITINYLCDVGQLSRQEAESLLDRLYRLSHESPPEPFLTEFPKISEVVSGADPTEKMLFFDLGLNILQTQGESFEKTGIITTDLQNKNIEDVFEKKLQERLVPLFQQALHGNKKELAYRHRNRHFHIFICPRSKNQKLTGGVAVIRDITIEHERRMQLRLLYKAIETTKEMVVITDAREKIGEESILYVNKGFEDVTGYTRNEVLGKNPSLLQGPDTDPDVIDQLTDNLSEGKRFEGETFNYRKDGSRFRLHWSIDPVKDRNGNITHYVSVQRDVTRQWQQQEQLKQLIAERESMLKEIHHRIKNNLAVISGLLELQSLQSSSKEIQDTLTQSMNRIKSIAILHETLYKSDSFSDIELDTYFTEIAVQVIDSFTNSEWNISIETDIAPVSLSDIQAMPCGLILNEVITNSCKHAFSNQDKCIIRIQVHEFEDDDLLRIRISDNGCGLPEDFNPTDFDSLGMSMIENLCRQLDARYTFSSSDLGTTFTMEIHPERV